MDVVINGRCVRPIVADRLGNRWIAREVESVSWAADEFRERAESFATRTVTHGALLSEDCRAGGIGSVSRGQAIARSIHINVPCADFLGSRDAANRSEMPRR